MRIYFKTIGADPSYKTLGKNRQDTGRNKVGLYSYIYELHKGLCSGICRKGTDNGNSIMEISILLVLSILGVDHGKREGNMVIFDKKDGIGFFIPNLGSRFSFLDV
jgi:hypothetical protein